MTRAEFTTAYRDIRKTFRVMNGKTLSGYPTHSPEDSKAAEDHYIEVLHTRAALVCGVLCDSMREPTFLSNGALYSHRHGLYAKSAFPKWVREKLARRAA